MRRDISDARILKLWESGMSQTEIASRVGASQQAVRYRLLNYMTVPQLRAEVERRGGSKRNQFKQLRQRLGREVA